MFDEVDNATLVLEGFSLLFGRTLIFKNNFEVLVEESHCLQALHDGACNKLNTFGREDGGVWIEGHRGAGLAALGW